MVSSVTTVANNTEARDAVDGLAVLLSRLRSRFADEDGVILGGQGAIADVAVAKAVLSTLDGYVRKATGYRPEASGR